MSDSSSTLLDPIETTVPLEEEKPYRELRYSRLMNAFENAKELYQSVDVIEGSQKRYQIDECRTFIYYSRHKETGEVVIISNACRMRWCPICGKAKQWNISQNVTEWLKTVKNPKFATFTLKHSSDPLREQIMRLYDCFRLLRKTKLWKQNVSGGIWFFHVKRSESSGEWHPHLHVLLNSKYIPREELSLQWEHATKGSKVSDIRSAYSAKAITDYVARYCATPAILDDYDLEDQITIYKALHRRRVCGKFGSARSVQLSHFKMVDKESWQKIGSYYEVNKQAAFNPKALRVIEACIKHEPLDEYYTIEPPSKWMQLEEGYSNFMEQARERQYVFEYS